MDVLPVSGAGGSRRRYRNGRGTRLGGEHPLSLGGPQTVGGSSGWASSSALIGWPSPGCMPQCPPCYPPGPFPGFQWFRGGGRKRELYECLAFLPNYTGKNGAVYLTEAEADASKRLSSHIKKRALSLNAFLHD